jgi:hypothetical protein
MSNGAEFLAITVVAFVAGMVCATVLIALALREDRQKRATGRSHRAEVVDLADHRARRSETADRGSTRTTRRPGGTQRAWHPGAASGSVIGRGGR